MASRRPLIVNSSAGQIQELTDSDDLSLPNSSITAESMTASSSVTAGSFVGGGTIPVGGIIMWSGSVTSIPSGWALCDGSNSTPDLRNRFVVGASSGTGDTTYPGLSVDATGGSADAAIVTHTHSFSGSDSFSSSNGPSTTQSASNFLKAGDQGVGTETISISGTTGTPSGAVSATNANLPPYYALAFIMRTT